MFALQRNLLDFVGTLVVLAWALHEMVHWHEVSVAEQEAA